MACPRNFSWIDPGKVAGHGFPHQSNHLEFLVSSENIRHLVTLTEWMPPACTSEEMERLRLVSHHIPVRDYTAPSLEQIHEFIKIVKEANEKEEAVAVHCMSGKGRTGTFLACYLADQMTAEEAISTIRRLRPGSIETSNQEQAVARYAAALKGNSS
jgi:atypical dual specificity phosphatase